jgi:hypothetical protein
MSEVFELYDQEGQFKKYIELNVYPQPGDLIRIIDLYSSQFDQFRTNIKSSVSIDKTYKVLNVHNVTSIIIQNDNNVQCHLRPKDYTVVKEVTDDELLNIKYRNDALNALVNNIKKQKGT